MGDPKLALTESVFSAGQNEGIERAVLPAPELHSVRNARLRKSGRWGKRFGHTALPTANLGNGVGAGAPRCIGPGFAIVDDRCANYDQAAGAFVSPASLTIANSFSSYVANPRIAGVVSGWLPDTSFFPVPPRSFQNQTTTPCSTAFGIGYLWSVIQYKDPITATDTTIRVVATNPTDQTLVFMREFTATNTGFGGISYPKLMICGTSVILTYLYLSAAGVQQINGRVLTSLAGGFSADTVLVSGVGTVSSYDASSYSSTQFLIAYASSVAGCNVQLFSSALAPSTNQAIADATGNPITLPTVVGKASNGIYVGYAVAISTATRVRVFAAALGGVIGTATLSVATAQKPLLCQLSGGGVRCVYNIANSSNVPLFRFRDVTAAAALFTGFDCVQIGAYPISIPFAVGSLVYMWTTNNAASGFGYANLIRLPALAEFGTVSGGPVNCPLEMSVNDYLVSPGQSLSNTDLKGIPTVANISGSLSYAVLVPTLYSVPNTSLAFPFDFRILQVKHHSDFAINRSVRSLLADSVNFVPMGTLTRVDDRGATEEGFVHSPQVCSLAGAAGGGLVASSDYYYTAVFKSRNANGRYEQSAPATPVKVTLAAGQGTVAVELSFLALTARQNVQLEIYRSLSNTQTFYLAGTIEGGTSPIGNPTVIYTDVLTDTVLGQQPALYIQVGNTLANSFPPAARFGCSGGERLFLGGLIRNDVVQASKRILGDQSPSFADNDAFRIVLPAPCTGLAWMDGLVIFTAEGVYVATGDGPDDDGQGGDFGILTRLPFELGCIEPRSVITVDEGTFFQTARGLYLLPRGAGAPVAVGDAVMDTLNVDAGGIITGCGLVTKSTEQSIRWTCGSSGRAIVYDIVHKAWSVDNITDGDGTPASLMGSGQWFNGEQVMFGDTLNATSLRLSNSTYDDNGQNIAMLIETGDLRPFGNIIARGELQSVGFMAELRTPCTLNVFPSSDIGVSGQLNRTFTGISPEYAVGDDTYTEIALGSATMRNVTALRLLFRETSQVEGLAFIALSLAHTATEGLRTMKPADRLT